MLQYNKKQNILFFPKSKNMKNRTTTSTKKDLNIIDFIKQKNKFKIQDYFDEKGAKKFLSSKQKALMEIKLDDDIELNINNSNNNILIEEKILKNQKFKVKTKIRKGKTTSPRRNKKSKRNSNIEKVKTDCKKLKYIKKNKNISIIDINDSTDKNFFKFIIDNVDESEDEFMRKINKKIHKENTNIINIFKKGKDKLNKKKYKSLINKKEVHKRKNIYVKKDKNLNPFNFSEKAKNLMIIEDIKVSEINSNKTITPHKKKLNTLGTNCTSTKKGSTIRNIFSEQEIPEKNNILNSKDIIDDKSLLSILSDLIY